MGDKAALGLDIRLLEPADGEICSNDVVQNVGLPVGVRVQRVPFAACNSTNVLYQTYY